MAVTTVERPRELSVLGKRIPQIDAKEIVTGRVQFVTDIKLPGMLTAKVLRSPHPHAKILRIDATKAEAMEGVECIINGSDFPKVFYGPIISDELALAVNEVRYAGEEVAAVAAIDEDVAEEALNLIDVSYEPLPAVTDPEEALRPDGPKVHEKGNIAWSYTLSRGDVNSGFEEADVVVSDRLTTASEHQFYVEPIGCVANYELDGQLTMWLSTQEAFEARDTIAKVLGLPESKVRIIQSHMGGSFGGKATAPIKCGLICALLAKKTGRPVKLVKTREEEILAGRPRAPMVIEMKLGITKEGAITAKETKLIADSGAYAGWGPAIAISSGTRLDNLYKQRNIRTELFLVYTNKTPIGPFRGFGSPQMAFAFETLLDRAAEAIGMDPVELRLHNAIKAGELTVHGWKINSCGLSEAIRLATKNSQWERKRQERKAEGAKRYGIGFACGLHTNGFRAGYDGSAAYVLVNRDGSVSVACGEADNGAGQNTIFAQIAAEVLGLSLQDVSVVRLDTNVSPYGLGTFATRVTVMGGNAVRLAAENAREQLFRAASNALGSSLHTLEAKSRKITVKNEPTRYINLADAAKLAYERSGPVIGVGFYNPPTEPRTTARNLYGHSSPTYAFAAHVAEVEVDIETGEVSVVGYVAAHDSGRALNPMAVEGQIEGGVVQGIGYALMEHIIWKDGRVLNPKLLDYKVPGIQDCPRIQTIIVETNDPEGPFGAKGIGEPPIIPVAPAIANAIYNATGVRISEIPMTPEVVSNALRRAGVAQ